MRPSWALRRLCFLVVALTIIVLGGGIGWSIGNNSILAFMLLGSFLIHLGTRPSRKEWVAVLILAIVFRGFYGVFWELRAFFGAALIRWGSFLGLASLAVQAVLLVRSRGAEREVRRTTFLTSGALPYSWLILAFCLSFVTFTQRTYDPYLLAFDTSLGTSVSFLLGRILTLNPLLRHLTKTVYDALPLGASCILAWNNRSRFRPVRVVPMYISMMLLGYGLYWLYPAAGPVFAYANVFPLSAPLKWEILTTAVVPFNAPRNAMPSLHFGAMLLMMWNSRSWPGWGRVLAGAFCGGIGFATLALGEHYLVDLVVSFPFMLALQSVWSTAVPWRSPRRYFGVIAGVLSTAAWLIALRLAIPVFMASSALAWCCVLLTVGGTLYLEGRLAEQAWGVPESAAVLPEPRVERIFA